MGLRPAALVLAMLGALALAPPGLAQQARGHHPKTLRVGGEAGFDKAVRKLLRSGGTIVLRPKLYRHLVVPPRGSVRPLHIVGTRGARVQSFLFDRTQHVSLGHVTVGPISGDAVVEVRGSRQIVLDDLVVSARGTRFSAGVLIPDSWGVVIRHSNFTHCGDRSPDFANCVWLYRWSHGILIEGNRFHDCRGCDFIHGRFGTHLTIRRNSFDRTLPCHMSYYRCGHQDLVQLFAGRHLLVARNHFGVYKSGGAQLYLTNTVDYATIVNNVFVGTDPRVPDYHARMGIVVGSNASRRVPYYAKVVNNTILTGARRRDGYAGSIRMSTRYGSVPRWKRPIVANNVIALLETPGRVCAGAQRFLRNVVIRGRNCKPDDQLGPVDLDRSGRPRADSSVIGEANRHYAPPNDATGRRRDHAPDIGALEYRTR
jgi:hypothetical protein